MVADVTDGVIEYSVAQGVRASNGDAGGARRDDDLDLSDETYDGQLIDGRLTGGLGQLTDGEEGPSNFRVDKKSLGIKGKSTDARFCDGRLRIDLSQGNKLYR